VTLMLCWCAAVPVIPQCQQPSLGLDTLDSALLSDAGYLAAALPAIASLPNDTAKLAALTAIVQRTAVPAGGFYDNLGSTGVCAFAHLCVRV
jgi:hypothetical protein